MWTDVSAKGGRCRRPLVAAAGVVAWVLSPGGICCPSPTGPPGAVDQLVHGQGDGGAASYASDYECAGVGGGGGGGGGAGQVGVGVGAAAAAAAGESANWREAIGSVWHNYGPAACGESVWNNYLPSASPATAAFGGSAFLLTAAVVILAVWGWIKWKRRSAVNHSEGNTARHTPFFKPGSAYPGLSSQEVMRLNLIDELRFTEEKYVQDLQLIISVFLKPLQSLKTLTDTEMASIFSNIENLFQINKRLLGKLQDIATELKANPHMIPSVGPAFLSLKSEFSAAYSRICKNHNISHEITQLEERNAQFREWLSLCQQLPECHSLDLKAYIIKPLQRVCRYPLILEQLLKATPKSSGDRTYADLQECITFLRGLIAEIDVSVADPKEVIKYFCSLCDVQPGALGTIFPDTAVLCKDGILKLTFPTNLSASAPVSRIPTSSLGSTAAVGSQEIPYPASATSLSKSTRIPVLPSALPEKSHSAGISSDDEHSDSESAAKNAPPGEDVYTVLTTEYLAYAKPSPTKAKPAHCEPVAVNLAFATLRQDPCRGFPTAFELVVIPPGSTGAGCESSPRFPTSPPTSGGTTSLRSSVPVAPGSNTPPLTSNTTTTSSSTYDPHRSSPSPPPAPSPPPTLPKPKRPLFSLRVSYGLPFRSFSPPPAPPPPPQPIHHFFVCTSLLDKKLCCNLLLLSTSLGFTVGSRRGQLKSAVGKLPSGMPLNILALVKASLNVVLIVSLVTLGKLLVVASLWRTGVLLEAICAVAGRGKLPVVSPVIHDKVAHIACELHVSPLVEHPTFREPCLFGDPPSAILPVMVSFNHRNQTSSNRQYKLEEIR
ncbi:actin cortical patch component, with ef hand and wh2 motif panl [Pelomyxa schiedti]|nr:actin cortical patch component, with ef hand and wh2 motif panl [Pelomyxa schiedti]